VDSTLSWLDQHQAASKEEFDAKRKELENTAMPIMSKLAGEAGGAPGGAPGGFPGGGFPPGGFPGGGAPGGYGGPGGSSGGPTVDEVD
jgi:L1 cell adhesion molecule like protein